MNSAHIGVVCIIITTIVSWESGQLYSFYGPQATFTGYPVRVSVLVLGGNNGMTERSTRMVVLSLSFILAAMTSLGWSAEPKIQILSPKDGAQIAEDQKTILISGKVASDNSRSTNVDIFLILDTSG